MPFRYWGLDPVLFEHFLTADDAALSALGARRVAIVEAHSAPCRVSLDDASPGSTCVLLNFTHQTAQTPYRASGPIFVGEASRVRCERVGPPPPALMRRLLSLRAYDAGGMMLDAEVVEGVACESVLNRLFTDDNVAYVHAHYARRGCYAALIERAG